MKRRSLVLFVAAMLCSTMAQSSTLSQCGHSAVRDNVVAVQWEQLDTARSERSEPMTAKERSNTTETKPKTAYEDDEALLVIVDAENENEECSPEEAAQRRRHAAMRTIGQKMLYLKQMTADSEKRDEILLTQYEIGSIYFGERNYTEAFKWFKQSAEGGYDEAQVALGAMYYLGNGVDSDRKKAVEWYEKAIVQGNAKAMNNMGNCYQDGFGVEQNDKKAFEWWLRAAEAGCPLRYANLGDAYRDGRFGVKKSCQKAVYWYEKAVKEGDQIAQYCLSCLYSDGCGVKRDESKAFELLMTLNDTSRYYVQHALGEHYYFGRGTAKNIPQALVHYTNFLEAFLGTNVDLNGPEKIDYKEVERELKRVGKIVAKNQK